MRGKWSSHQLTVTNIYFVNNMGTTIITIPIFLCCLLYALSELVPNRNDQKRPSSRAVLWLAGLWCGLGVFDSDSILPESILWFRFFRRINSHNPILNRFKNRFFEVNRTPLVSDGYVKYATYNTRIIRTYYTPCIIHVNYCNRRSRPPNQSAGRTATPR